MLLLKVVVWHSLQSTTAMGSSEHQCAEPIQTDQEKKFSNEWNFVEWSIQQATQPKMRKTLEEDGKFKRVGDQRKK